MKAEETVQLKVAVPSSLHQALADAARNASISVEQLAADSIAQAFETALRHRVLVERQEQIDEALVTIAEFVGALSASSSRADSLPGRARLGDEG